MNQEIASIILTQQQIESLCAIFGETDPTKGFTKDELKALLRQCGIPEVDDGFRSNGLTYQTGLNKRNWLTNCLISEIKKSGNCECVFRFIETALNPTAYTQERKRRKYHYLLEETNKTLMTMGLRIAANGKLEKIVKAETLDEVDRRCSALQQKLYQRAIHEEVKKYCIKDYLRKDYFDAVFEASKGLAERVREMSGLKTDGSALFQTAFGGDSPYLFLNGLSNQSEKNEQNGLRELLDAIFHLVRNPRAHTPKIHWEEDETLALDILTMISLAHKYLDQCNKMPGK